MSTQTELLISGAVDKMIERLMVDYRATFPWAMRAILGSQTYQRVLNNPTFRGESPLYIYEHLKKELQTKSIL